MTTAELTHGVEWIEARYGKNAKWNKVGVLIDDFASYTLGAFLEAAKDLYREGRQRINPSDLIGPCQRTWRSRVEAGIDPQPEIVVCERHVWSLARAYELSLELAGESMAYDECTTCHETRPSRRTP